MLENITFKDVAKIENQFKKGGDAGDTLGHKIIKGNKKSKVMISCPHCVTHTREGKKLIRESYTATLGLLIQKYTKCHLIYKTTDLEDDVNYDTNSQYKKDLTNYIKENNIEIVLDLHGLNSFSKDIEIGTFFGKTIRDNVHLLRTIYDVFLDNQIYSFTLDKHFWAGENTIAHNVWKNTKAVAIQIEISKLFRYPVKRFSAFIKILNALIDLVKELNGEDIYEIEMEEEITQKHYAVYSDILDFKIKKIKYKDVPNNHIGMELEMGLNYSRQEYSFIRRYIKRLKNIVNGHGIFVRDYSIISNYPIEIALDPLSVSDLIEKYKKIKDLMRSSSGHLFTGTKYACGIHLNFNKLGRKEMKSVHKRLINYLINNPTYFVYNKFKKGSFITDYRKYLDNQNEIAAKYNSINYIKKGIIEIRNVKTELTPHQLEQLCNDLIEVIYEIKQKTKSKEIDFVAIFDNLIENITKEQIKQIKELDSFTVYNISKKARIK